MAEQLYWIALPYKVATEFITQFPRSADPQTAQFISAKLQQN